MGHERHQVAGRRPGRALVPNLGEPGQAFQQLRPPLVLRLHDAAPGDCGRDVGPAGEAPPLLQREVEQGREQLRRQLDRDVLDPVELLADRQRVQNRGCAFADQHLKPCEVVAGDDRVDRLALRVVLRRVHGDEHRQGEIGLLVAQGDAAVHDVGRERVVIRLDLHDVAVFADRPVRPELAGRAVVHGRLAPQPGEIRPHHIVLEQLPPARIEILQRHRPRVLIEHGIARRNDLVHENLPFFTWTLARAGRTATPTPQRYAAPPSPTPAPNPPTAAATRRVPAWSRHTAGPSAPSSGGGG